jgi:hypothetical protein
MIRDPEDDKIHLHVFSHATDRSPGDLVASVNELGDARVIFASQYVGSFQVYAHARVDSTEDAMSLSNALWPAGVHTTISSEVALSQIQAPKRHSPQFSALVRVRPAGNPFDLLTALDERFEHLFDPDGGYWYGAAVVTGRGYDVLVDLGRDTLEDLVTSVLVDLREVDGLGRTDTSWSDLGVNSFRRNTNS